MTVTIKSPDEIGRMRVAGRLAAEVLEMIEEHVRPGITTDELDAICHDHIVRVQGAIPAPLNYRGFPKSICTSVNHQVCHGIPSNKRLKGGDIVNVDITVIKDGYHGDTSKMFFVGEPSILARRLVRVTQEALRVGIAQVRPGATLGDIGHAIQRHCEAQGFSVVREYCGHGIGREFHEEPQVLHYGKPGKGWSSNRACASPSSPWSMPASASIKLLPDGWTVVTKDRSLSAQWEHTILVTPDGHDILTLRQEECDEAKPDAGSAAESGQRPAGHRLSVAATALTPPRTPTPVCPAATPLPCAKACARGCGTDWRSCSPAPTAARPSPAWCMRAAGRWTRP